MSKVYFALSMLCVFSIAAYSPTANSSPLITEKQFLAISPHASRSLVAEFIRHQEILDSAQINNNLRFQHFIAQVLTETGGLLRLDENLNYNSERLIEVFKMTPETATSLARRPREIANYVYGAKLGNGGRHTDDGWNFRGSGHIQLTGRYNFRKHGLVAGLPLEDQPELARSPKEGLLAATAYWLAMNINVPADANKSKEVRARINPALLGYPQSLLWLHRVQDVTRAATKEGDIGQESAPAVPQEDVSRLLRSYGFIKSLPIESASGEEIESSSTEEVESALRAFQRSRKLPETGTVDTDTLYALTDPAEWRNEKSLPTVLNEESQSHRVGISYDLSTRETTLDSVSEASKERIILKGDAGRGILQTQTQMSKTELASLNEVDPFFAPYEKKGGIRRKNGNFVPFSVTLPDTRVVIPKTTEFPARAIVQITFSEADGESRKACTGAMVAKNVVLTAGHCVHSGNETGKWHKDFLIIPARNGAIAPFGTCKAIKLFSVIGWVQAKDQELGRLHDLGAIRLDCNIGEQTGWFSMGLLPAKLPPLPANIYGYPCDKTPTGRQWRSDGSVEIISVTKIFYDNDTYGCMSGSPVFTTLDSNIIAVHTNGHHGTAPWDSNNAATRLSEEFIKGLLNFSEK